MMKRIIMVVVMVVIAVMAFGAPESIEGDWMVAFVEIDYKIGGKLFTGLYRFIDGNMQLLQPGSGQIYKEYPYRYTKVGREIFFSLKVSGYKFTQFLILFNEDENVFITYLYPNNRWTIYVKIVK